MVDRNLCVVLLLFASVQMHGGMRIRAKMPSIKASTDSTDTLDFERGKSPADEAAEKNKQLNKMLHDVCLEETGVSQSIVSRAERGQLVNDEQLKCYLKCLFVAISMMDEDCNVDESVMTSLIPESHVDTRKTVLSTCKNLTAPNACQLAFDLHACARKVAGTDVLWV